MASCCALAALAASACVCAALSAASAEIALPIKDPPTAIAAENGSL